MTLPRARTVAQSLMSRYANSWPGRVFDRSLRGLVGFEVFDRSMTLAAQAFTSLFPLLILVAMVRPRREDDPVGSALADSLGLSQQARDTLVAAMPSGSSVGGTFGVLGAVVVLLSATSYSRALLRMYTRVWGAARPPGLRAAWRWVATLLGVVVLIFVLSAARRMLAGVPLSSLANALVAFVLGGLLWTWAPWILLAGRIQVRMLVPGGVLMAAAMMLLTLVGRVYLPISLSSASRRFGVLGISFTYITWLFVVMFCLVATTVVGAVIARDPGPFARLIRGDDSALATDQHPR
jgi:membrane protein